MYTGSSKESVECPVCGTELYERRPPFRFRSNNFQCINCETRLRFSRRAQKRLVYVVIAVVIFGLTAYLMLNIFGDLAGVIAAICGAGAVLGMLVWQGKVPQLEVDT